MSARNQFDLRLALCFAAVAEERSFTRAARRLGMAQPSVSEQVKRLEEQLGVPLFARTSRKVELTAAGAAFLPLAQHIVQANDEAQSFARQLRRRSTEMLRIGAPPYSAEFEERSELIGHFMAEAPHYSLDIAHAWSPELIEQLRGNEIDLAFIQGSVALSGLDSVLVHRSFAHYLVPAESPLAAQDALAAEDLRGQGIVSILPDVDPATYQRYYQRLADSGAVLVPTPEHHFRTMEQFARTRRLVLLRFGHAPGTKRPMGDMVRLPSRDAPPLIAEMFVVRRSEPGSAALERFWRLACRHAVSAQADDGTGARKRAKALAP